MSAARSHRGYLLDGGPDLDEFAHKRLSYARKELLVEARVEADLTAVAKNGAGTNQQVLASFDSEATLEAVRDMYRDVDRGAAIDVYWAFVALNSTGPMITYAPGTYPPRSAFKWNGEVRYIPGVSVTGAGLVFFDQEFRIQDEEAHEMIYGVDIDSGILHALNRHDALGQFVKHLFLTRSGRLFRAAAPNTQYLGANFEPNSMFNHDGSVETQGTRVDVASLADEGQGLYGIGRHFTAPEFFELINVATGHALGHLLVDIWHEIPGIGALIGNQAIVVVNNGAIVRINGLDDVEWNAEAIGRINLSERFSVE